MRLARHHKAVGGLRRRQAAPLLALLALLAGQALLPAFHFAAGRSLAPAPAAAQHHAPAAGHHHAGHEDSDGGDAGGKEHQACHFCRLVGVALPPPPPAVVAPAAPPRAIGIIADRPLPPKERFEAGRPARAPPPIA